MIHTLERTKSGSQLPRGVTRRWFIGGACSALSGCIIFKGDSGAAPILRLGILSDIHLRNPGDENHFLKALRFFRDGGVDGVVISGDIADTGRVSQLERAADCWFSVFPGDTAPDGRRVERLFVYGNHDVDAWRWRAFDQFADDDERRHEALGFEDVRAKTWERLFHEPFAPIWMKTVKGIRFIGAHWNNHCPGIERFMEGCAKDIDPDLPFFYIQHSHPKDTCYGPAAWGHDPGYATRALSPFRNAVAISGHSHYSLSDERSIWQGSFTSIGASSLRRTSLDYLKPENANGNPFDPAAKEWRRKPVMRPLYREDGKQGMVADVYSDRIKLSRRDFVFDESLGEDWMIPIPSSADTPFAYARRARIRKAPAFADGSKVRVEITSKAPPCARDDAKGPFVHVTFPAAAAVEKCRVFEYEVRAVDGDGRTILKRRVMAPGFHLPEAESHRQGECLFTVDEFEKGMSMRFEVRASECFGRQGAPITSEKTTIT